ncbi:MAG: 2-amino-4-hydroxy-6-hydroxymethyldihydropteridine diphosphokinase [Halieaceae bacterium]|nr:2-amino-4-hydroxy-6-hydroxymethyldihydropteridine diphosphokinase [Halieaceae bacterium]
MTQAFVGLGSNINEPAYQLRQACMALISLPNTCLIAVSSVYESSPMGPSDQPPFLNACAQIDTTSEPAALLTALLKIETAMGRVRRRHWGERCIDLDLLFFGNTSVQTKRLTLPHPGLYQRDFVLKPLADMLGNEYLMPNGVDIGTLLQSCPAHGLKLSSAQLHTGEIPGNAL